MVLWTLLTRGIDVLLRAHPISADYPLINGIASFFGSAGLVVAMIFLLPPVSALVGGCFLDDAAAIVEETDFPQDRPGKPVSLWNSVMSGLRFAGLALGLNLLALTLIFVPVVNVGAFFAVNTYLLGREYFEMAASRFRSPAEAAALRRAHRPLAIAGGAVLAGLMLIPVLNLLTPIFGIALMVHLHKQVARQPALEAPRG